MPDARANWINQDENDWDDLIPVADKKTKVGQGEVARAARSSSCTIDHLGIIDKIRDEWVLVRYMTL